MHNVIALTFLKTINKNGYLLKSLSFFLMLQNAHALSKKISSPTSPEKLPQESCFELQKKESWDSFIEQTRIPQKFCVKSISVEKVYTNQVAVRVESNDIPHLLIGDIIIAYRNGEKKISLSITRQELSKKDSDYFGFAKVDLLFTVDTEGKLISEIEADGYVMETEDLQKSDGKNEQLIYKKTN